MTTDRDALLAEAASESRWANHYAERVGLLEAALQNLVSAYSGKHSPQHRKACLVEAMAVLRGAQGGEQTADTIENLATMLRRLIWQINKMDGDLGIKATAGKAKQLLWKYGLQGNLLRIDEQTADTVSVPRATLELWLTLEDIRSIKQDIRVNVLAAAKEGK